MRRAQAERLLPHARLCPRDAALEEATWNDVLGRLYQTTPRIHAERPGLAFFEPLHEGDHVPAGDVPARDDARALIRKLGAQGAVAPARSFARLAAYQAGPGHTLTIESPDVAAFLQQFQTNWLPMACALPAGLAERLVLFGYRTLADLRGVSDEHLSAQFGLAGTRLYQLLHPQETEPPQPDQRIPMMRPLPCVSESHMFEQAVREPGALEPVLQSLIRAARGRLRDQYCQRIEVKLTRPSGTVHVTSRVLRGLTQDEGVLQQQATILLRQLLHADRSVGELTLVLGSLGRPTAEQGSLFAQRPKIQSAIEAVQRRYPRALLRAQTKPAAVFEEERYWFQPIESA
jgi:hypothetical protein